MNKKLFVLIAAIGALPAGAFAADLRPAGYFVQAGVARHDTYNVSAGAVWQWSWHREFARAEAGGVTELFLAHWSASSPVGRHGFTQLGLLPLLRLRLDRGQSNWFLEGGIGVSVMDHAFDNGSKQFSTRFNFVDTVGVGRSFGANRNRELSLRFTHVSNGGIKEPNPGENFLQVRYGVMF